MPSGPAGSFISHKTFPVSLSYARMVLSEIDPPKISPPAVTATPPLGQKLPVPVIPFSSRLDTPPNGMWNLIAPVLRSYAVSVDHGGLMAGNPSDEFM